MSAHGKANLEAALWYLGDGKHHVRRVTIEFEMKQMSWICRGMTQYDRWLTVRISPLQSQIFQMIEQKPCADFISYLHMTTVLPTAWPVRISVV